MIIDAHAHLVAPDSLYAYRAVLLADGGYHPAQPKISDDALAIACGAEQVARRFAELGCTVERVSSWGMHWLEPLVEIDGFGFGPVGAGDVEAVLTGNVALCVGPISEHPFIAGQTRLTFARAGKTRPLSLDDYAVTGGWHDGTVRMWRAIQGNRSRSFSSMLRSSVS